MGKKAKSAGSKKKSDAAAPAAKPFAGAGGALLSNLANQSRVDLEPTASLTHAVSDPGEFKSRVDLNKRLRANLAQFWKDHGIDFALFWLMMPPEDRLTFVQSVVPDIKAEPAAEDPTDLLLPEMNMAVLQAQMGKGLVAVMQTRASVDDSVEQADLAHCQKLDKAGQMPIFSGMEVAGTDGDAFKGVLAFVLDDQRIVVCGNDKSEEEKANSRRMIADGKVTDANQFITKNVRRTVLLQFCCGLADKYLEEKGLQTEGAGDRMEALAMAIENVEKLSVQEQHASKPEKQAVVQVEDGQL